MSQLLDALGGRPALTAAVDLLYDRLLGDPALDRFFAGVDLRRLQAHMIDFLAAALGSEQGRYHGRDMVRAHAHLAIADDDFDRVATHLVAVLDQLAVPAELIDQVVARVAPLRPQIVTRSAVLTGGAR